MIPLGVLASSYVAPAGSSWSPADIATIKGWWDADDASTFAYSSGTLVSQWDDKSGQGRHFGQGTVSKQPSRSGTINGRSSVVFNGTSTALATLSTFTAPTKPSTVLIVARSTASSGQRNLFITYGPLPLAGRVFRTTGGTIDIYQQAFLSSGVSWGTTVPHSVAGVFNGISSKITVDGGSTTSGYAGGGQFQTGWAVGAYHDLSSEYWQGDVCEIVHVDGEIGPTDLTAWFDYCATKWGT